MTTLNLLLSFQYLQREGLLSKELTNKELLKIVICYRKGMSYKDWKETNDSAEKSTLYNLMEGLNITPKQ